MRFIYMNRDVRREVLLKEEICGTATDAGSNNNNRFHCMMDRDYSQLWKEGWSGERSVLKCAAQKSRRDVAFNLYQGKDR